MAEAGAQERLEQLLGYLGHDPENAMLLRDTAQAAMDADDLAQAQDLFARLRNLGALTDADSNQWAIAAMRAGQPAIAAETFAGLLEQSPNDPALRFNLAWARAMAGDPAGARELLDQALVEALPQAAQLEIHLMHSAGEFEEAAVRARAHLQLHPDYPPLLAAISVLALDVEDEALARDCAQRAGGHPDAITTLATLALAEDGPQRAKPMFEQALAINNRSPRAWVGLGLAELAADKGAQAGRHLDQGAEIFGDHLGSWIAAGWAYLTAGDAAKARERFEHAVALDDTFAEAQGSLAVIEVLQGERAAAERRTEVALRLDRKCFSAAFAKALLSGGDGDAQSAQQIVEIALKQPIGPDGTTLAEAIARMAR